MLRVSSVVLALALTGCPGADTSTCNADPGLPACIVDAGTVGGLTYRTHPRRIDGRHQAVEIGACGGYRRLIDWQNDAVGELTHFLARYPRRAPAALDRSRARGPAAPLCRPAPGW